MPIWKVICLDMFVLFGCRFIFGSSHCTLDLLFIWLYILPFKVVWVMIFKFFCRHLLGTILFVCFSTELIPNQFTFMYGNYFARLSSNVFFLILRSLFGSGCATIKDLTSNGNLVEWSWRFTFYMFNTI